MGRIIMFVGWSRYTDELIKPSNQVVEAQKLIKVEKG